MDKKQSFDLNNIPPPTVKLELQALRWGKGDCDLIDMLYIEYKMTKAEYNNTFKLLQQYLRRNLPSRQLHKDKDDNSAYVTNGLARIGFQEIRMRSNTWGYRCIEIRLRPQLLINPNGYYQLTTLSEFEEVNQNFNYVLRDNLLLNFPDFYYWNVKRVESAVDLKVEEHLLEKYFVLFKKGNIPDYFFEKEQTVKYWNSKTNLYLAASKIAVNWYNRYETLVDKNKKSRDKYLDFSETKGVLRFETQVRKCNKLVMEVLNQKYLQKEVMKFYKSIVGKEDFYSFEIALKKIDLTIAKQGKKDALEKILRLIVKCGSINNAKVEFIKGKDKDKAADIFSKRINQIRKLGINPIIIPSDWGIGKIDNLYSRIEDGFVL